MGWEAQKAVIMQRFVENVVANVTGTAPQVASVTTVSVSDTDNSFNDATEDLSIFTTGQRIIVSGFTESANNGVFTVITATSDKITVNATLVTEAAGDTVTIASALPVQFDNDSSFNVVDGVRWVRLTINGAEASQVETGTTNGTYRNPGMAIASIFVPKGVGNKQADEIVDLIITAFRRFRSGSLKFFTPYPTVVGQDSGTGEWQINVNMPFYFDD